MSCILSSSRMKVRFGQESIMGNEEMSDHKEKEEVIEFSGVVTEEVRGAFRVKLDDMDHVVLCRLAGKMRKFRIRVVPGDRVSVEVSPYDMSRGRITFRER